jgi:hypothetical protein
MNALIVAIKVIDIKLSVYGANRSASGGITEAADAGTLRSTERVPRCSFSCIRHAQLPPTRTKSKCKNGQKPDYRSFVQPACNLPFSMRCHQ